jgi:hypothetical protein
MTYLFYLTFYLILGYAAVYMINQLRSPKKLSTETTILITLSGSFAFFISLIVFLLFKAVNSENK